MKWILIVIGSLLSLRYFVLPIYVMCWCEFKDWQREKQKSIEVKDEN